MGKGFNFIDSKVTICSALRKFQPKEREKKDLLSQRLDRKRQKDSASSVNRTRASSMATTNSTTRPMMLERTVDLIADSLLVYASYSLIK
ncbi:hypothetical protein N7541_000227 [Penicillium brevicompactum]|uniref:Uncharacterized protein n=1 Tax=Penicillium brevicompactum TaxID=5074 RepID=A0A9W9RTY6_PENBR|nr:hypothetical protein N7541_000227 [Penicillium brevicompactum]